MPAFGTPRGHPRGARNDAVDELNIPIGSVKLLDVQGNPVKPKSGRLGSSGSAQVVGTDGGDHQC